MERIMRLLVVVLVSSCLAASPPSPSDSNAAPPPSPSKLNLPPPPSRKYKIMMLLPFGPQSHRNCFLPLAESLADRGHQIVILSALPPKSKHPNIKEVNHGIDVMGNQSMFHVRETDPTKGFSSFEYFLPKLAREMYDNPEVMDLYNNRKEFDLFIIDALFNEPAYPFLESANYVAIETAGFLPTSSAILGNVLNPSYIPSILVHFSPPFSFKERVINLFGHLYLPIFWRHIGIFPAVQKELSARFPALPSLAEIEKGLTLVLANTHFSLDFPMPILPSQVQVGGMHCRKGKTLPKDLKEFIEGSGSAGVIYFSLGSVCKGNTIPDKYKKVLVETLSKLKQRVIWKFEEDFEGLPSNIMIKKWLPQQDILAHPKVKLFITHGGLLSMQESLFHGKPLLALPVFGDQEGNAMKIRNKGFGNFILWEELNAQLLASTIQELIENPKYIETISYVSEYFRDQETSPLERAVWWTEYVIRHKGAPQLKSPAADMCWIAYFNIDIIIAIHFILLIVYWVLKKLTFKMLSLCSKSSEQSKLQKKKKA